MLLNWSNSQGLNALMNSAEFIAGFADKGSGEVDLVLSKGTGSATFTRATTATTVNSSGTIVSVASGTPRSYYDPTTLQYMGYLAEGARTNLLLRSEEFDNASWTKTGTTVSANAIASPDGTVSADKLLETAATSLHFSLQAVTVSSGATVTLSVFAKAAERSYIALLEGFSSKGKFFDLATGTVLGNFVAAPTSASIKAYPNGWYLCSITTTVPSTSADLEIYISTDGTTTNYAGNITNGVYVWGAQLEAGSFASTYIPTTTASVTRNADVLTYPYSGNVSNAEGSCYAELSSFWTAGENGLANIVTAFGTAAQNFVLGVTLTIPATQIRSSDTVTNATSGTGSSMNTGVRKCASSWSTAANAKRAAFAGLVGSDATYAGGFQSTAIGVGCATNGSQNWNGTIRNMRFYQTQLSASQLQSITS